jgi:hypothetical protein
MKRRLPLIAVAVVIVLCVVGVAVAAAASGGSALAYEVNGTRVSQSTVNDELDWLSGNQGLAANVQQNGGVLSATNGSITSSVSARWLTQRIQADLMRDAADQRGVTVPKATENRLRSQYEKRFPKAPSSVIDVLVDGSRETLLAALGIDTETKQQAFFRSAQRKAAVYVNPVYGTWRGLRGVCPPTGCLAGG